MHHYNLELNLVKPLYLGYMLGTPDIWRNKQNLIMFCFIKCLISSVFCKPQNRRNVSRTHPVTDSDVNKGLKATFKFFKPGVDFYPWKKDILNGHFSFAKIKRQQNDFVPQRPERVWREEGREWGREKEREHCGVSELPILPLRTGAQSGDKVTAACLNKSAQLPRTLHRTASSKEATTQLAPAPRHNNRNTS